MKVRTIFHQGEAAMDSNQLDDVDLQRWADDGGFVPPKPEPLTEVPLITVARPKPQRKPAPERIDWQHEGF